MGSGLSAEPTATRTPSIGEKARRRLHLSYFRRAVYGPAGRRAMRRIRDIRSEEHDDSPVIRFHRGRFAWTRCPDHNTWFVHDR